MLRARLRSRQRSPTYSAAPLQGNSSKTRRLAKAPTRSRLISASPEVCAGSGRRKTPTPRMFFPSSAALLRPRACRTRVTPKLSVAYKVNDDLLFYVLAAQGFRQGGTNDGGFGSLIVVPQGFNSDTLWNYEAGIKSAWLERR